MKQLSRFLIAESGDDDEGTKRIFLSEVKDDSFLISGTIPWPTNVLNVESCAVAAMDNELVFIFAERAEGSTTTNINWATMSVEPLKFGPVNSVEYHSPSNEQEVNPGFRPVSALKFDNKGNILVASAIDPDSDIGPFASNVWLGGQIISKNNSSITPISILDPPEQLASIDGLKVEGIAVRANSNDSGTEVIVGTDDEFSGGVLRILPLNQTS